MASNSITNYLQRLGKSISYAAFEVLKEQVPVTTNFIQSNSQTVRDTIKAVVDSKNTVNRVADALNVNTIINSAKTAYTNAKTDIKTGNFYNPDRTSGNDDIASLMAMMGKMMGEDVSSMMDGIFNEGSGEDGEGSADESPIKGIPEITKGDTVVASVIGSEVRRASNSISDTLAAIANANGKAQQSIASVQISQNERQTLILNAGLSSIAQGMNSIIEFNNKVLKIQAENTKLFQEKMINLTTENNAIFKELIEIQRVLYKPKQKEEENPEQPPDMFANGFNLKSYMDYLKRNVEKNPMYQMAYMFIQSLPMMLQEVVNNPLQFATKKLIEGFMGPALKTALASFDNTISNAFRTVLTRLYDYGHDVGTKDSLLGKLARIFGYKEKSTSFRRLDTSKYNKGAMSWNGIAQKSLVEVIPAYLRRIEAAATGKGERYFDYQSGRWTSAKSILNMEKGIDNKFMLQATSEIRTQMQTMLAPFMDEISDKDRKEVNTQLLKFLKGIYDRGSVDYKDIMRNPQNYGDNERLMQLFFRMLAKTDRDAVFRATGRIANAKKNKTRMVEGTDASNQGIYNDIASGALKDMVDAYNAKSIHDTKYNITSSPAMNLTNMKDSRGLTLYDYQLMIYRELFAIRHGGGIGGGGNGEGTVDPLKGFAIKDNQLPDIIKNESSIEQSGNQQDIDINDPRFKSNRKSTKQEFFDRNRERVRNLNRIKVMSNGLEMEDSLDLQRYLTDDEYANYVLSKMNEIGSQTMKSRRQSELDSNKGMIGNVMNLFSGGSNQGYPDGVDPDAPFIEQMAQAATIGQKMGVISRNLQNIASAPTSILTGVITTADKFIYDMLFDKEANTVDENGESKKTKGIFGKFISEIEDMFGGVNDWLNDIFKNLSESSGGFAKKIKDILKNVFNFDVDEKVGNLVTKAKGLVAPVGEVLKSGVKNNFKEITNAFRETAADLGYKKKQKPKSEQEQDEEYWGEMGAYASGAQNVKKGGLAFISEGEAIIPADLNPWNPNRDRVNRKEQSKNEFRMKQRFMSKLGSTLSPYISQVPQHANGSFDFKANASSLIHKIPKPMLAKLLGEISNNPEEIAAKLEKNFGIKLDPEEINRYKNERLELETQIVDPVVAKQILQSTLVEKNEVNEVKGSKKEQQIADEEQKLANYNKGKGAYNGINQFLLSAFGKDTSMAAGDITEYVIKHSPEMATGGIGGALLATVLPLGGPLFGAIAGSVVGLLTRNKSFMEYMFGSEMTDPKTGKVITKEGVIPRKIVNTIQKYMPDMKKYGIVGTLTGLITPFGPLGGLMIGAGASIVKNNEDLKRILFGEETGLLNKNRKQFLKKALPNIGAGVLATLFFGPMGILGNAAVGAGLGLLTTTEQFKRVILGTKDRNGIRRGGLAGAIRDQITEPFKNTMRDIGQNLGNWFRDKVLGPIGRGLIPTGKIATSILSWGINTVVRKFSNSIGGRFLDGLFNFALGRIRNVGGLGKFITKKIGGLIAGGSNLIERAGSKIQALGLKGGFGENLTVGERLEIQSRNNMMHTDRAKFDMALAKLNPRELQANAEALEMLNELQNGSVEALTERKVRSEAYSLTSDLQGKMGGGKEQQISKSDVRGIENKLRKIQTDKDLEDLVTSIDKDRKYSYINDKNKEEIKEFILKNGRKILEMRRRYASLSDSNTVNKLRNTVKERMNLAGVDDETFNKHLADYTKYANAELERQDKTLSKKLMADKESGKLQPDATVDNLIKMTDFQKAQLEEQKEMNKNLRTLIEVALGNKSSVLGQTKDVDMLRDQNKMDKISRDLDSEEDRINRILGQNKVESAKQVKGLKKDIFGESANNGALQHMSDENLLSLLGPDKKKRNEAITYMRAISSNYDKTLSKLMNTDKFLELSSIGMRRITELTLRGYEVKPEDYKDIESLSKYGYKAIIELAKMGVKIDSYKAIDRYFDKYGTGTEKKKSLNALLDFAGVKLKDGRKIAEVLTTSEIADNLEDDDVRLLRANNEYNSYQIGINKAIKEGNVPEKLKLASTASSEDLTTKKKGDALFDADKAVSNTNLDATIQKTADLVDNTVKKIYDTNKSVLKTVLEVVGQFAEAGARKAVPGADTILDTREAIKNAKYNEGRLKNDEQFAEDQRKSDLKYESTETYLKHQQGTSQKYNVVEEGFEKRRDPGRNNSITEAKAAQQRKEERRKQEREERKKQEEQKKADSTTATTTVSGGKLADEGKVPKVETTVNSTMNHMAEMLTQMMSGYSPVDMDDNIGTHAGGLLSAFTNTAINSLAEKISPGSTAKFSDAKSSSDNKGEQQQTTPNKPQPINALEEANNERQMNSITDASKVGFTLNANPVAGETGGTVPNKPTDDGNVNLSTGDGDPVQYTKNRNGELVEVHNKNNVEVRAKQKYKLELQERSTRALELIAKGAGYAGNKVVSGAKKATGGIFDLMKGLFTMPLQLIGSIVSMIPFAGPLLRLAGKGLGFIGKFLGGKLLENVFNINKDDKSPTDELDNLNDELKDRNQNNIDNKVNNPDTVNTKSKTLKDRFKDFTSGIKDKTGSITESLKDKVGAVKTSTSNITNNIQNIDMKRTTDSAIQTARKGIDEGQLKVQALVGQLKDRIMALTSKLGRWIKGDGVIKAIKNFTSKLIESITRPQNMKKIINKLAKSSLKSLALGGGPLVIAAITGVGAISDFISGYNNSDELYHLSPGLSTPGMKIVAGFISALVGVIPYISILIPEDFVLELAVEYIGPAFGFGKKELEELRKSGKEQQDKEGNEVVQNSTFGDDFQSLVKNATGGIISKVVGAADDAASAVADVGKTIANKVGESASVAKNWVADTAKTVGDWISDKASRGWEYLKDKANSAAETVGEIYDSASSSVKEKYESVKQTIKDNLPSFGSGKHSLYGMNKFYSQLDPKYAMDFNAQGDSIHQTMKDSGCGPAALSNAMSSVGIQVDPRLAAQYALQNGYKETDGGTRPEFFTDMMNKLGTGSNRLHNQDEITNSLKQGQPVILMGKDSRGETKQNPYAENPHYVTATGIDRKGNIIVQDPESYTPNKRYKASDILNKSTIAIGTGRSKKRLYGRSRSTINRVANKIISRIPRMYGRSRYGRGSDMGAEIFDYLHKGIGLSTIATAGIMGNMKAESGLMPDRVQGDGIITAPEITVDGKTGYGLCQWTFESRQQGLVDFAQARGTSTSDMKTQCDYMMQEIEQNHAGLIQRMDETGGAGAAAIQFHDEFEGSADDPEMKQRRATYAEEIFQNEGRGMAEAGTYQGGSSASSSSGKKNGGLFGAIANISSILSSALNPFGTASASPTTPKINNTSTVDGKTFSNTQMMANYGNTQGKEVYGTKDADGNVTIHTQSADNAFGINSNVSNDSIANDVLTGGKELTFKTGSGKHRMFKSKYGRLKHFLFGTGDEESATSDSGVTTTTTEPSTNTPNMDAQEVKVAQDASANTQNETKPKTTSSSSLFSGGLFSGIESFAKQVASPLSKVMSKFGGVLKTGITSVFGDKLKLIFGDNNPFLDIFTGGDSGSSSNGNKPGSTAGPGQTVNIKVAGNPVDTLLGSMPGAVVTSDYGVTDGRPTAGAHGGVDIGGLDIGTPIPSPIAGTVYQLGQGHGGGYGHYVQLVDKSGNYHMFAHCDEQMVQEGQQVQPGTILGTIGKTGVADGEHLHYEIDPPSNVGAIKEGEHINPNSYTGAGKHFNSTLKDRMPSRFGRGIDTSLLGKQSNDTFEGLDNTKIENTPDQNMDITQNYEYNKPRDDTFVYDGFGDNDPKYKYGTGWFSDFTKKSINTIRDTFDRWFSNDKKEEDKETTNVSTDTQQKESSNVPSKQPDSVPKTSSDVPVTTTTTPTKDSNIHPVSDSQKLDAILDAMNENNRLVQQQNQLLSSLINIASNYINSNVVTIDENQKVRMNKQESQLNTNTRRNNPTLTGAILRSQLSQFGGGSQYGLGDRFGTRDGDGFNEIIRNMNTVATR